MAKITPYQEIKNISFESLQIIKNKIQILVAALKRFLEELKKREYIRSFKKANKDKEMINLAEEGLEDYLKMIDK